MEYTIQKLAQLAGVSTRTLRYYDEIGLLHPARINTSGYRIYRGHEVRRLQQILLYRELDISLDTIKTIIDAPEFDSERALVDHRHQLLEKKRQLEKLIHNVDKTIADTKGALMMTDKERFEGLKAEQLAQNEEQYGEEIRAKYGADAVAQSNTTFASMTADQHAEINRLATEIIIQLKSAFVLGDPASDIAQRAADLHRQWISYYWPKYTKEAHRGVAQMYVEDERFTAYYDKEQPGLAAFLRDAIVIYTK